MAFNGMGLHLGNLSRISDAESRSISPENPTGERGKGAMAIPDLATSPARELGQGWKVSPYIIIKQGETATLADIAEVHRFIHRELGSILGTADASAARILYGGSVKPSNARDILAIEHVGGALVGGASLKAADFLAIAGAALPAP